jgi:hypothetical protein
MSEEPRTIDLDEVVRILKDEHQVPAYVEQTGGGTATIYAGWWFMNQEPQYRWEDGERIQVDAESVPRFPAIAGPGWFEGPGWTKGRATVDDFYIGPDDDGEADPVTATRDWTERDAAAAIARQVKEGPACGDGVAHEAPGGQ